MEQKSTELTGLAGGPSPRSPAKPEPFYPSGSASPRPVQQASPTASRSHSLSERLDPRNLRGKGRRSFDTSGGSTPSQAQSAQSLPFMPVGSESLPSGSPVSDPGVIALAREKFEFARETEQQKLELEKEKQAILQERERIREAQIRFDQERETTSIAVALVKEAINESNERQQAQIELLQQSSENQARLQREAFEELKTLQRELTREMSFSFQRSLDQTLNGMSGVVERALSGVGDQVQNVVNELKTHITPDESRRTTPESQRTDRLVGRELPETSREVTPMHRENLFGRENLPLEAERPVGGEILSGAGMEEIPSEVQGQARHPLGEGEMQPQGEASAEGEAQVDQGMGRGGGETVPDILLQEEGPRAQPEAEVGRPDPHGEPMVEEAVENARITRLGSVSLTKNIVLVKDRHTFSLGLQGKLTFGEGSLVRPAIFLELNTHVAAQTYAPLIADGRGSSTRFEIRCCQFGIQAEHGKIHPRPEGSYQFNRLGVILPVFRGHQAHTGISLARFLPPPIKQLPGLNPSIQIQGGHIIPYVMQVQGKGVSYGLGFGPFKSSFQVFEQWFIPNIRILGHLIASRRYDDRLSPPIYRLVNPDKKEMTALAEKIDKIGIKVGEIAKEQKSIFHGNPHPLTRAFKGKVGRKGLIDQIEALSVSVQKGFEQSEECCIRQHDAIKRVDKKLEPSVEAFAPIADLQRTGSQLLNLFAGGKALFFLCLFFGFALLFAGKRK